MLVLLDCRMSSWSGVGRYTTGLARALAARDDIELVPVTSEFFAEEFPSVRPRSEIMRNMVLDLQGMNTMRPWRVAIEEYLMTEFSFLRASDLANSARVA